jgi:hypothetical protein
MWENLIEDIEKWILFFLSLFLQDRPSEVLDYLEEFNELERDYFDAYAYDTIWTLGYIYQWKYLHNQPNIKKILDQIDFIGATVRIQILINIYWNLYREELDI